MFSVYVLRSSKTGRRYVDPVENLTIAFDGIMPEVESDQTRSSMDSALTRELFYPRSEAVRKERYYKTGRGRDELDQLC